MTNSMTGDIENVHRAVAEVVPGVELSDLEVEGGFDDVAVFEVFLPEN
jgi:hypothetical protein